MRFYNQPHKFYCGVDLHARTMYLCILDHAGNIVLHEDLPAEPAAFLEAIAPYRNGLVEVRLGTYNVPSCSRWGTRSDQGASQH